MVCPVYMYVRAGHDPIDCRSSYLKGQFCKKYIKRTFSIENREKVMKEDFCADHTPVNFIRP